jgi:uncharacterized membrane protein
MRDPIILDQTLRPSPPMAPSVLKGVLAVVVAVNLAFALAFAIHGAWLVMPFMGIDIFLLAWAFRASTLASRQHERVTVTPSRLVVERHPARGNSSEVTLNPYWVRVEMAEPPDHWSQLTLRSHGRSVRVGSFLAPGERASFAQRLKGALRHARDGASS